MDLYKYIDDPDCVQSILNGELKFSPIADLNDPSELTPVMVKEEVEKSRERILKVGYTDEDILNIYKQANLLKRLAPEFPVLSAPITKEKANEMIRSSKNGDTALLRSILDGVVEASRETVGIFCLSRRKDCLPMWAHYAKNASGLLVKFRNLDKIFTGDDTGILHKPLRVDYDRDNSSGVTFETNSHKTIFFSKFPDWKYEEEVRVVIPLKECRAVKKFLKKEKYCKEREKDKQLYLYEIPKTHIYSIIYGWNMSSEKKKKIYAHIQKINSNVKVTEARIVSGRIRIHDYPPA